MKKCNDCEFRFVCCRGCDYFQLCIKVWFIEVLCRRAEAEKN